MIDVDRLENQTFGHEKLGFDPGPHELLRRHAVVFDKAQRCKGGGSHNAHPAYGFRAEVAPQTEVDAHGDTNGQDRKNELPQGQSKKHAFGIIPDFPVDLDFQNSITSK